MELQLISGINNEVHMLNMRYFEMLHMNVKMKEITIQMGKSDLKFDNLNKDERMNTRVL